ncbi:hypothetical protein FHG87_011708 [Trinorchestia longiramus]|nr:hypothetical protein FHG87_011708 [Trinorchestia longiramus]
MSRHHVSNYVQFTSELSPFVASSINTADKFPRDQVVLSAQRGYATRHRIVRPESIKMNEATEIEDQEPLLENSEEEKSMTPISSANMHGKDSMPVRRHAYSIPQQLPDDEDDDDLEGDALSMEERANENQDNPSKPPSAAHVVQSLDEVVPDQPPGSPSEPYSPTQDEIVMEDEAGPSSAWDDDGSNLVLMTFVGRRAGVKHVKRSLRNTIAKAKTVLPSKGKMFNICEKFDTYQKGGLYPLLHVCGDRGIMDKLQDGDDFPEPNVLGDDHFVEQAVYREIAHIEPPPSDDRAKDFVITVAAFRSIQHETSKTLVKNWKSWTGARAYMLDMAEAGVDWQQMTFYARERPFLTEEDRPGFYYILVCKVGIREPSDEGLIVDVLQRFRVERWFGYQTIYRSLNQ